MTTIAFIITGFVPAKKLSVVRRKLEVATEGAIYLKESKVVKGEKIPVEMDNPKSAKPFEFLTCTPATFQTEVVRISFCLRKATVLAEKQNVRMNVPQCQACMLAAISKWILDSW